MRAGRAGASNGLARVAARLTRAMFSDAIGMSRCGPLLAAASPFTNL